MLAFSKKLNVHFIGIGGIGMSGIAEILLEYGYAVSGSDVAKSAVTEKLQKNGAKVFIGHNEENVKDADIVVYSSAIDNSNPEIILAKRKNIPIIRRAEMLAELMRLKIGIAVAGAHGKTTTTSMIATIFNYAKLDPTHVIGGIVHNLGSHAKKGKGDYIVVEADESDGSFLLLNPIMCVVTNIDNDHLDYYKTVEKIHDAFVEFINSLPFYGKAVMWGHDKNIKMLESRFNRRHTFFGIAQNDQDDENLDYFAKNISFSSLGSSFDLFQKNNKIGHVKLQVTGEHNILNALAAIALSIEAGVEPQNVIDGIYEFQGVGRRLEKLYKNNNFEIIDDYGHHPTEIKATIKTLKQVYDKKLVVVFEPHRFSRTKELWSDFLTSFAGADEVFIAPIYAASEKEISGISSATLVAAIKSKQSNVNELKSLDEIKDIVLKNKNDNTLLLTLGAGAISKKIRSVITEL